MTTEKLMFIVDLAVCWQKPDGKPIDWTIDKVELYEDDIYNLQYGVSGGDIWESACDKWRNEHPGTELNVAALGLIVYEDLRPEEEDEDEDWYFTMDGVDVEEFGPYDTELEALEGIRRIQKKAKELGDGIERTFTAPYQGKRDSVWND